MPKKICLAPGHGGFDAGAAAHGYVEKSLVLAIGLALQAQLTDAHVPVLLTRSGDYPAGHATNLAGELEAECAIANNAGADMFFGLHAHASAPGTRSGAAAWVYRTTGESADLATQVVDALSGILGAQSPPVTADPSLTVLRGIKMAGFVLELGCLENQKDAEILYSQIDAIAQRMAAPIIAWAGGVAPQPLPDVSHLPADVEAAITKVEKLGIMTRDSSGNFSPDATVTRWELAVVVDRILQQKG